MRTRPLDHGHVDAGFVQRRADVVRRIVRADDDDLLALEAIRARMCRRMMLLALEGLHPLECRQIQLRGHAGRKHELLGVQRDFLAIAIDDDLPFLLLRIESRALDGRFGPIVQLHHLGVHLQPIADLVLGREHRPILRKVDIGQMVVPDRIVQTERLIALAPGVAGALVLFRDDRGHAKLPEARAKPNGALAAADDQHIGLRVVPEPLSLLVPQFLPGLCAGVDAVPRAEHTSEARLLLMALEFDHGRQQGPDRPVLDADEAITPCGLGLERYPGFEHAVRLARDLALGDAPIARLYPLEAMSEHVADLIAPFHRLDVPSESDEIAPIAVLPEHGDRRVDIVSRQRGVEPAEEGGHTGVGGCVEHDVLPMEVKPALAGGFRWRKTCARFETLASRDAASTGGWTTRPWRGRAADRRSTPSPTGIGAFRPHSTTPARVDCKENQGKPRKKAWISGHTHSCAA